MARRPTSQSDLKSAGQHHLAARHKLAEAAYRRVLSRDPSHIPTLTNLAVLLFSLGRMDDGLTLYRRIVAAAPNEKAGNHLMHVLAKEFRWEALEALCQSTLIANPDDAAAWNGLTWVGVARHRWSEAEFAGRNAVRLDPAFAEAWNGLSYVLNAQMRWSEAESAARTAVAQRPDLPEPWSNLGRALLGQQRKAEAAEALRQAKARTQAVEWNDAATANFEKAKEAVNQVIAGAIESRGRLVLSDEWIRALNGIALDGLARSSGEYRRGSVSIRGRTTLPPNWTDVPLLVRELCSYVNDNWARHSRIHLSAFALWRLNWIHPFSNGNGRVARLISYAVLTVHHGQYSPGNDVIVAKLVGGRRRPLPARVVLQQADALYDASQQNPLAPVEQWISRIFALGKK